jgi:hypothetical protein
MQTAEQLADLARKAGVPLPYTSKQLNFMAGNSLSEVQSKYKLIWIEKDNIFHLCRWAVLEGTNRYYPFSVTTNKILKVWNNEYPAPQFHEIFPLLPNKLPKSRCSYKYLTDKCICYIDETDGCIVFLNGDIVRINVKDMNVTQAAAELYLRLKSLNLL